MRRKIGLRWVIFALVLMVLSGCAQPAAPLDAASSGTANAATPPRKRSIRIAHQNDAVIVIGRAKGWFEEEFGQDGTEVTYTRFVAGPPIMESFSAGRQDIGTAGDMPPVAARATGVEVQVVGISSRTRTGNTVVVRKESSIQSVADLKGKKLAAQVGSSQYHYALLLLDQKGLAGQVSLVNIPLTELRTVLEAGTVDAIVGNERLAGTLEHEGAGRVLPDSVGVKPGLGLYVARSGFLKESADLARRFLAVVRRINEYIQSNPDEAAALAEKETGYAAPVMAKIFRDSDYDIRIKDEDTRQLELVRDFLRDTNVIKKDFDVKDLVDPRFAEETGP